LRTINASTQAMLTAAGKMPVPNNTYVALATDTVHSGVSYTAVAVDTWLAALRPYVTGSTRAIRLAVLAPLWGMFTMALLAAIIVVGCAWWWS
jgi:hypothetical protein